MKTRYRLTRRGSRGDTLYCVDSTTGKRTSLNTSDEDAAEQIVLAKNQAERQPALNLQIAKAYMSGTDRGTATRTWKDAIESLTAMKQGANQERWRRVVSDKAFVPLWPLIVIETQGDTLLKVLQAGCVSTNIYLRRLHNFCCDMSWLPWFRARKFRREPTHSKAKGRVMFFPHLATDHKGILNAMANEQAIPVQAKFPHGASSVTLVLWGSTGCPAKLEAFDQNDKLVDSASVASVPGRKAPADPVPFFELTVKAPEIAYIRFSGPRNGEFLAADAVRFVPLAAK